MDSYYSCNYVCIQFMNKYASWKHFDAEIRDKILRLLTKKTIFNAQIERAYPVKSHNGTQTHTVTRARLRGTSTFLKHYITWSRKAILCRNPLLRV